MLRPTSWAQQRLNVPGAPPERSPGRASPLGVMSHVPEPGTHPDGEPRTLQRVLGDFGLQNAILNTSGRVTEPQRGTSGAAGGGYGGWEGEVDSFVRTWQRQRSIGDRWAKGLGYLLGRIPRLLSEAQTLPPVSKSCDITEEHVAALRVRPGWEKSTTQFFFADLRQFLRWKGNPVTDRPEVWRLPASVSQRRRWITREQLV